VEADRKAFQAEKKSYEDKVATDESERDSERVVKIANAFKAMKTDVAADQLVALYRENRATCLYVLARVDEKSIGKIFSKMPDPVVAARILDDLKAWRVRDDADLVVSQ
jgi:flagellar motility protein MotE (MotC chaperone)